MDIRFYRGRLLVGFRMKDWSPIWLELEAPDAESSDQNADREYNFDLFRFKTQGKHPREPEPSEVYWLPHYDVATFEGKTKPKKESLQKQFLSDCWIYLSARDPREVRKLEKELDQPDYPRWQSWFRLAKKYKRRQLGNAANGINDDDDDSDDDSAYGGDDGMGPPPTPAPSSKKRKGRGSDRQVPGSKRAKCDPDGSQTRLSESYFQMSGGLGPSSSRSRSVRSNINGNDYDTQSDLFDSSDPEGNINGNINNIINERELEDDRSSIGSRRRGESRELSLRPFNAWDSNRDTCGSAERQRDSLNEDDEDRERVDASNNGLTDEAAERAAIEQSVLSARQQSVQLRQSVNRDLDDDEALEAALEASRPRASIEAGSGGGFDS